MSLQKYLPSKRFMITFLGVVLGIVLVLVVTAGIQYRKNKKNPDQLESERLGLITNEQALKNLDTLQNLDSDGDGLADWEEALWGTNPTLVDSDGNGISDFDEVESVKNKINQARLELGIEDSETLTELDKVSRDLYATLVVLDQNGELDENTQAQVQDIIQEKILLTFNYDPATLYDLTIVESTFANRAKYTTQFNDIMNRYPIIEEDYTYVVNNSLNPVKQQEALDAIEKYQNYVDELLAMSVPVDGQQYHLNIVNATKGILGAITAILYSDQDPMIAVSAATQLPDIFSFYHKSLEEILIIIN